MRKSWFSQGFAMGSLLMKPVCWWSQVHLVTMSTMMSLLLETRTIQLSLTAWSDWVRRLGRQCGIGISNSESESRTACSAGQTSQLRQLRPLRPERRRAADSDTESAAAGVAGELEARPGPGLPIVTVVRAIVTVAGELAARPGTSWRLPRAWPTWMAQCRTRWARPG